MKRFTNLLVYAGTREHTAAINRGVNLAIENDARLKLIDVIKPIPAAISRMTDVISSADLHRLVVDERRDKLLQIAADYSDTGVSIDAVVRVGNTPVEIVREVIEGDHDLVIKSAEGGGTWQRLFGGVAQELMRNCPCPVWVFKPDRHAPFDRVLVALDLETRDSQHNGLNRDLLDLAHSICQRDGAQLHVVTAWDLWMEKSLRRRAGDSEVDAINRSIEQRVLASLELLLAEQEIDSSAARIHLEHGKPGGVIHEVEREIEADLLVLGTVCRTGVAGLLIGNTAEHVLANADCSVLTLKPAGFVTPVTLVDEGESQSWFGSTDLHAN
jgi:universal stress protein E